MKLVRIHPSNNRLTHTVIPLGIRIAKADGWCRVTDDVAKELAKERMNSLNPNASPPVFEIVADPKEAKQIEAAVVNRIDPVGTPDAPVDKASSGAFRAESTAPEDAGSEEPEAETADAASEIPIKRAPRARKT